VTGPPMPGMLAAREPLLKASSYECTPREAHGLNSVRRWQRPNAPAQRIGKQLM
jgi:hypothetical protein